LTKREAKKYIKKNFNVDIDKDFADCGMCALIKLRHEAVIFPEYDVCGNPRDSAEWAFIDAFEKIDTRMYGTIYYFGERNEIWKGEF
jgi:hypothetical protein